MRIILLSLLLYSLSTVGCRKSEPELSLSVTTDEIEVYSEGIYCLKGTIACSGCNAISEHGFIWSESDDPETDGTTIRLGQVGSGGSFSILISNFEPGKTYYVKAFATYSNETYYGPVKSFETPDDMIASVIDIDQNIYRTVKIGDQTWMAENLKATHYPDGNPIQRISERWEWFYMPWYNPAYCWYENYSLVAVTFANLYSWPAAMHINSKEEIRTGQVQGVCPDGWHLPDDEEWKKLEIFLGMNAGEAESVKWRGTDEGGKLKYTGMWDSPNSGANNESGFTAIPAGYRDGAGDFYDINKSARFWSSSLNGDYAWMRQLDYNSSKIFRDNKGVYEGLSIRCVKNSRK